MSSNSEEKVIELNVGGSIYASFKSTLVDQFPNSKLANLVVQYLQQPSEVLIDSNKRLFIDRNGTLFRFILDYLRCKKNKESKFNLPETFRETSALKHEATFFGISDLVDNLEKQIKHNGPTVITLGYRGTFAFGRDGLADVKFRKLSRILVSGKVAPCKEVFQDTLNMSRDPDCGYAGTKGDRYSARFFLKHNILEQAFDSLYLCGYKMVGCCGSGTNSAGTDNRPGQDSEESKWQHYNEFVFVRM